MIAGATGDATIAAATNITAIAAGAAGLAAAITDAATGANTVFLILVPP
jgi:hypothetical protein